MMAQRPPWLAAIALLVVGIGLGAWFSHRDSQDAALPPAAGDAQSAATNQPRQNLADIDIAAVAHSRGGLAAAEVEHRLFVLGSLRGTRLDGAWGIDENGRLPATHDLRRRFDQLLTTVGEVSVEDLGRLIAAAATRDHGPQAAAAIMEVWHRYVKLEGQEYRHAIDLEKPESLLYALQERQLKRREILGPLWADAFYRDEEQDLRTTVERLTQAHAAAAPSLHMPRTDLPAEELHARRVSTYGAEAAARLAEEDRAQSLWDSRLEAARAETVRLQKMAGLSPVQRERAMSDWLASHFDQREQVRVRALLGR